MGVLLLAAVHCRTASGNRVVFDNSTKNSKELGLTTNNNPVAAKAVLKTANGATKLGYKD